MHRFRTSAASAARPAFGLRSTLRVGRSLLAALALAAAPAVVGAQGGTSSAPVRYGTLDNQAVATFSHDGIPDTARAGATILVARQAALLLTGSYTATMAPGQRRLFSHQLTNRGTNDDLVSVAATASAGWTVALYQDVDRNGQLTAADVRLSGPIALRTGATIPLLIVLDAPATAAIGDQADAHLSAVSGNDGLATVSALDHVTVTAVPAANMTLAKTVDHATGTIGDTLRYTLSFSNAGDGDAHHVALVDTLPRGLQLLPGTMRLDGVALTDTADADAGTAQHLASGRDAVRIALDTVPAGVARVLTIDAVIARDVVVGSMANIATLGYGDSTRTFAVSAATSAVTQVSVATLGLTERLIGTPIVTVGAEVHFRLTYSNTSATEARNTVLVDTLPIQLIVETAAGATVTPSTTATGARVAQVLTWPIGALAAGATGSQDILAKVDFRTGTDDIADHANVSADNAETRFANIRASIAAFVPTDLKITKTAAVLDAAIGDAVPYTVTVHNVGVATLHAVIVRDRLPEGMRFSPKSVTGADSVVAQGLDLAIYLAAPLAPDASASVRYAAVVATPAAGAALENRAVAEAEGGLVRSDTARALVTQRGTLAMRERTMIGKVWLDRNANGVQDDGEEGVAGVQVWDVNGDVATTDKEGRFSFRNVATGMHALRLDPLGIPRNFVFPSRGDEVVMVQADGWSLPNTSIRLVPRAGAPAASTCSCSTTATAAVATPAAVLASAPAAPAGAAPAVAAPAVARVAAPTVPALVSADRRAFQARRELLDGPGMHIMAPMDGAVLPGARFFTVVKGIPGASVGLYDGDSLLAKGTLRGDGTQDFLNVELTAGPHHLRIVRRDSGTAGRGDSIMVHVTGVPSRFVMPAELAPLRRDASRPELVRVQVLDRWNVPVANQPMITVSVTGAEVDAPDEDPSSVGRQLHADAAGWVTIPLRAGQASGAGELRLSAEKARATAPLRIYASVRSMLVTGVGQVGLGAAPETYSAMTVQGAVTNETSVTLSYDSRRGASQDDFFQRGYDPLGDEQFPTVGDNSSMRSLAPTTRSVAARVEHGMDWVAAGDVQTEGFGNDGDLDAYRRALTGVSARLGTGALTWHGFGSMTQQAVERSQLRGDGSTGPYLVGSSIRAGTEVVAVEVRALDNAARVISRQQLVRTADYEIDYETGAVLLRLPIPATDPYGNPVFLVATVERLSGGAAHFVGGLRVDADAARFLHLGEGLLDSLTIGVGGIRDDAGATSGLVTGNSLTKTLLSSDLRLRRGGLTMGASVLRSASVDSTGTATSATGRWALPGDQLVFDARWMSVGAGMGGTDPRLASALTETSFGLAAKFSESSNLRMHRDESRFSQYGVTRATTGVTAEQTLQGHKTTQDVSLVSESSELAGASSAITARVSTSLTSKVETWVDGTHSLIAPVAGQTAGRPNEVGTGVTIALPAGLKLEGSHRVMRTPGDSLTYGVTSAQLRADGVLGGQVWTGFEESTTGLRDEVRAGHSALLGWNQKMSLGAGWALTSLYERRIGLSRASLSDPERALPFAQAEKDRWSASAGLGWLPGGDQARLVMNAEMQSEQGVSSSRIQLSGDMAINAGLAVLALNDWSGRTDATQGNGLESRQDRSVLGLAMRPVTTNRFNALTKLEWRRTLNAGAGTSLLSTSATSRDLRLIASTDAVWAPLTGTELSLRYAARITTSDVAGDSAQRLHVADHFAGARLDHRLVGALHLRADGRLLMETGSGTALWNAAPSVLYDLQGHLTLEAGYRFGGLRDPDFAAVGGAGAFASVGFRFTEGTLASPAAFWRERIANDR